ncbi:MAG: hypothetical protein R3B70_08415 [Polyangiaceae bacterium]
MVLFSTGCVGASYEARQDCGYGSSKVQARAGSVVQADDDADDEADAATTFAARAGGTATQLLRVEGDYITGPNVSIGRYTEDGERVLRGVAYGTPVEMRIHRRRISGAIGNAPVEMMARRRGMSLDVHGLVAQRLSRFKIDEQRMVGQIGGCGYALERVDGGFAGRRSCGSRTGNFTLELPASMASWSDAEVAAVLALFLGQA